MRRITSFFPVLGLSLGLIFLGACDNEELLDPNPCDFPLELDAYTLIWADEFEGTEINPDNWTFEIGDGCDRDLCGWGNNELQYYTDRPENARVEDGRLIIEAKREIPALEGYSYSSARMITKNKQDFQYGRIDIHAKLPKGQGIWPAIWMLPTENKFGIWPKSGEIDIMELIGNKPGEVFSTVHYGHDFWRFTSLPKYNLESGDFSMDYNTFSVLWRDDCIRFMVNGELIEGAITPSTTLPTTYPFNEVFHLILNIAVGGNLPGDPDGSTIFPQTMEIDYIRAYQEK
jgi:beta-glucanase (GH16 family)